VDEAQAARDVLDALSLELFALTQQPWFEVDIERTMDALAMWKAHAVVTIEGIFSEKPVANFGDTSPWQTAMPTKSISRYVTVQRALLIILRRELDSSPETALRRRDETAGGEG